MIEIDDNQHMAAVKMGDTDSLVPIFNKYNVKLYNFFLHLTREKETSEDLTQTVFSRILSYKDSFDPEQSFKSWMYQIARNVHYKHHNKNKNLVSDYIESEELNDGGIEAISIMERTQRHQSLYDALKLLNAEQQEIIELSRFQDLKYEEIAKITGNTVGAVKVKVHRAIKKLKEVYFQIA